MRWLFPGTEIRIATRCLDCGQPILIRMRDDEILETKPKSVVGHINIGFAEVLSGKASWGKA